MRGPAFVGVSLDSTLFSRKWVRRAVQHILANHSSLEFVIGDRLLAFNKSTCQDDKGNIAINLPEGEVRIAKRANDIYRFLVSEVARLSDDQRSRIVISKWDQYADSQFVSIARVLAIAYATIVRFQQCVDRDVEAHLINQTESQHSYKLHKRICVLYVIEETAMIIRITESGRPFEYYPQEHIYTLTDIYSDRFADLGLTVESLVGHARTRRFTSLPLAETSLHSDEQPQGTVAER